MDKELNKKIKYLKNNGWNDDLIKQQLNVDYELGNNELIKDIIKQIDIMKSFRKLALLSIPIIAGGVIIETLKKFKL